MYDVKDRGNIFVLQKQSFVSGYYFIVGTPKSTIEIEKEYSNFEVVGKLNSRFLKKLMFTSAQDFRTSDVFQEFFCLIYSGYDLEVYNG